MFDLSSAPGPVRDELRSRLVETWQQLAKPGTWWSASERRSIAETARAARLGRRLPESSLPDTACDAAGFLATESSFTTRYWVESVTNVLGDEGYVELAGIVARVVGVDTFLRLLGLEPELFLDPLPGEPSRVEVEPRPKHIRSWIPVGQMLIPPFTLALVPEEAAVTNALYDTFYMTSEEMQDPDYTRRGLHRTQIEFVAASLSYENECFY